MKRVVKKGFTIVELAIVIAVIAVLAAVLIPTISGMVKKAKISAARSKAANMSITIAMEDVECNYSIVQIRKTLQEYNYTFDTGLSDYYFFWNTESRKIDLHDVSEVTANDIKVCVNYIQLLNAPVATASVDGTVVAYADGETSGEWQSLISTAELFEVLENFDGKKTPESLFKKGSFALTCFSSVKETMVIAYKTVVNGKQSVVYYRNGGEIDAEAAKTALGYVDEEKGFENNDGTYIFMTMTAHEMLPTAFPINIVVTKELSPFEEIIMSIFSGENFNAINAAMKLGEEDPFATMYLTGGIENGAYLANIVLDPDHVYDGDIGSLVNDATAAFAGIQKIFEILGSEAVAEIGELSDIYIGQNVVEKMEQFAESVGVLPSIDISSSPKTGEDDVYLLQLSAYSDWQIDYLFQLLTAGINEGVSVDLNMFAGEMLVRTTNFTVTSIPSALNTIIKSKAQNLSAVSSDEVAAVISEMLDNELFKQISVVAYAQPEELLQFLKYCADVSGDSIITDEEKTAVEGIVNKVLQQTKSVLNTGIENRTYTKNELISVLGNNTVSFLADMVRAIATPILQVKDVIDNSAEDYQIAEIYVNWLNKITSLESTISQIKSAVMQAMDCIATYGNQFYDAGVSFYQYIYYGNGIPEWYYPLIEDISEVINGKRNMMLLLSYMANTKGSSFLIMSPNDNGDIDSLQFEGLLLHGLASFDGVTLLVETTCTYQTSDGHTVSNPLNFLFRFSIGEAAAA